jgi:hypothetical protein
MWLTTDELNFVPALGKFNCELGTTLSLGSTTFPCRRVQLSKYDSMVAIVSLDSPSTTVIWVNGYSTGTPAGAGAASTYPYVPSNYRYTTATVSTNATGSGCEVLSTRAVTPTTGIAVTAATTSCMTYLIEIKSADLREGYPYVAIAVSTSGTATTQGLCVNYVLKPRYPQNAMMTAIS